MSSDDLPIQLVISSRCAYPVAIACQPGLATCGSVERRPQCRRCTDAHWCTWTFASFFSSKPLFLRWTIAHFSLVLNLSFRSFHSFAEFFFPLSGVLGALFDGICLYGIWEGDTPYWILFKSCKDFLSWGNHTFFLGNPRSICRCWCFFMGKSSNYKDYPLETNIAIENGHL